jgi:CubicO group peptidase (beta-lactamase class C family)
MVHKRIDRIAQSYINRSKSPSISYLIFDQDNVLHSFQAGYADLLNKREVTEKTTYCGFSVTKTFTALAILQLAESGKISLNDRVSDFVTLPYSDEITIEHLLSHSAGIPNPIPLRWVHSSEEHETFNRDRFFKQIFEENSKQIFVVNEKYKYSNLGYVILGQVIENISGVPYEDYISQKIIGKLGIDKSELGFKIINAENHAKGYQKRLSLMNFLLNFLMDKSKYVNRKEGKWNSFKDIYLNGPAHGGLIGTPNSFMIYLQDFLKDSSVLISDKYKNLMLTENKTNSGKATGMCLSWFIGDLNGKIYFCHAGGGAGYYCEIRLYPQEGIGSLVMLNRSGMKDERILDQIDEEFFAGMK